MFEQTVRRVVEAGRTHRWLRPPGLLALLALFGGAALLRVAVKLAARARETGGRVATALRELRQDYIEQREHRKESGNAAKPVCAPHRPTRRALAGTLAACMLATLLPVSALAAEPTPGNRTIALFDPLEETQVYRLRGTPQAELDLPKTLGASIYAVPPETEQSTIENIVWTAPNYDAETAGDYMFTASADGYDCAEGVAWPTLTVTLTVPITIAVQPVNQEAAAGETVTFTLAAEEENLSYQWQRGLPGPEADFTFDRDTADSGAFVWTDIDGAMQASYSFSATLEDLYDVRYRCAVTDGAETLFSNEVFVSEAVKVGAKNTPVYWSDEGARATAFAGGDGTSEENAYQISTPAQFGYMAYCLTNDWDTYKNKCYKLTGDIDLSGHKWTPVGSGSGAFMGTFDGGDFSITNMQIDLDGNAATDRFGGLFGKINGATVKNVTIGDGSTVTAHYTGNTGPIGYAAVVGDASGSSTIENCHSSASVSSTFTNDMLYAYVGGVVGYLEKGTVKNCSNSGAIGGTSVAAGGVAGANGYTSAGTIQNSWNTGKITVDGTSSYAGGIVGDNYHSNSKVENCYNIGDIEGIKARSYFGGVAGSNSGTVRNCYSAGILTLPDSNQMSAGGLIGDNFYGSAINSYWRKDTGVNETLSGVDSTGTETNVLSFGNEGAFTGGGAVTIGGSSFTSLLSALSAWVTAQGTGYWFWTGEAATPTLSKDPPPATYAVTINVQKDSTAWNDHGKTFKLVSGSTTVTNLNSVVDGTYDVYEGDVDTGEDVAVNGGAVEATVDYYTVTFYDGDTAYASGAQAPQIVLKNSKAAAPASAPTKSQYVFDKWVTENNGNSEFDFANTSITATTGVYAKWTFDTSTEVEVTLKVSKEAPYYKGDSLILTAEVSNKNTHAPVETGTVRFYKGDALLGDAVGYVGGEPPKGFYLSIVCGESNNFPYLAVGDNSVKAVYTPSSGTDVLSDTKTFIVLAQKDGNAYLGAVTVSGLSASSSGVVPVQFTVTNNGNELGIEADDLTVAGTKDGETFTAFSVSYNGDKTIAYVHVTQAGSYAFTAKLKDDHEYAATETASATVAPSYVVTVAVNRDSAAWTGHGKTFTLQAGSETPMGLTDVPNGTYKLLDGGTDTGRTVTVTDGDTTVTLDYYTVSFSVTDAGRASGSRVSAVYGGAALSSGSVVLGGKQLTITAAGAGADRYTYLWSGSGTNGAATAVLTLEALAEKVDALCTVSGSNYSSGSSDGSHTTTEKHPDGSTTTTVTKPNGTVTETTKAPDGTKTVVETKKDGTKTETVEAPDGTKAETVTTAQGDRTYTEQRPDGTKISADAPMGSAATAKVTLPEGAGETVVSFPVIDGTVVLRVLPDGTEEPVPFSLVENGKVYVRLDGDAELKVESRAGLFDDMDGHWAEEAADFTGARDLFQGTAPRNFAPEQPMTRAMLATVLYRMDGRPQVGEAAFDDVNAAAWYAPGAAWASENGIAAGNGGAFEGGRAITRQELAVMLWRYAKYAGLDVSADGGRPSYSDMDEAAEWAVPALEWACGIGVLQGDKDGVLDPTGTATRAEVAAMLERFVIAVVQ